MTFIFFGGFETTNQINMAMFNSKLLVHQPSSPLVHFTLGRHQVTAVAPGECDPECPPVQETVGAPAAVQSIVEQRVILPATEGVTLQLGGLRR